MSADIFEILKDLPVAGILNEIIAHAISGGVAIVTAETSSGKTMLVPAKLQEVISRPVFVAEPRRFLAVNAAETLADLTGTQVGEKFGYAVSARGLDNKEAHSRQRNGLTFSTYGYMLAAGIVSRVDDIVIDEAHEPSIDTAMVKALIKKRLKSNTGPKSTIIMSATLNAQHELDYWQGFNPKVFTVPSQQRFKCNFRYEQATPIHLAVLDLVEKGHRGILVFVSGVRDIDSAKEAIQKEVDNRISQKEEFPPIEVFGVHGNSDYEERHLAFASPDNGVVKVLIGTNVIKTGMNLPWVDAGVSSGLQKETVAIRSSGAMALQEMPISMDDLIQQKGRTNRFKDSSFILIGAVAPKDMKSAQESELSRLPLEKLYMYCLTYGTDPRELDFSVKLDPASLDAAKIVLQRFGFIDEKDHVTEDGKIAQALPVGLEAAALLCHANKINNLGTAIVVAAVLESGLLKHDRRRSHGFSDASDLLDAAVAFAMIRDLPSDMASHAKKNAMKDMNVNIKKYGAAEEVLKQLERLLDIKAHTKTFVEYPMNEDVLSELRQCILASGINRLGTYDPRTTRNQVSMFGSYLTYGADNGTAVSIPYDKPKAAISANLRVIEVKERRISFTVAEQITVYELDDLIEFGKVRPGVFELIRRGPYTTVNVFGELYFTAINNEGTSHTTATFGQVQHRIGEKEEGRALGDILMEMIKFKNTSPISDTEVDEDSLYNQIGIPELVATSSGEKSRPVVVTALQTTTSGSLIEKPETVTPVTTMPATNLRQTDKATETTVAVSVLPNGKNPTPPMNKKPTTNPAVPRADLLALKARLEGRA